MSARVSSTAWRRFRWRTPAWASRPRIKRQSSRSSGRWAGRRGRRRARGWGSPCVGSSWSSTAGGSGCRARWGRARRSRSRSRCAVANELILLVEDNERNRRLMRDVLAFKGYRLAEAETGEDGVRLARELHPDLILMDIQLPGINGIAAFRKIREDPATATIPVMAVTASAMTQDRQKIMAAGFEGYQSKPLNVKAFVEAIEEMLQKGS